jgi:ribosomal protein S17E
MAEIKDDVAGYVTNQQNRLVDVLSTSIKELRREYKNISDDLEKTQKMMCVVYMDNFNIKRAVSSYYEKYLTEFKNEELAILNTIMDVDAAVSWINDLLEPEESDDESEDEESDAEEEDRRSSHRKRNEKRK